MAFTTVVTGQLFEQLSNAISNIAERKGPFMLVMLIPSPSHDVARWNAVFSAQWLDPLSLREAVRAIFNELRAVLPESAFSKIQSISILRITEPFVREVTTDLEGPLTPGTAYRVQGFAFSKFGIDEAVVFVANPPSQHSTQNHEVHNSQ